MMLAALLAVLAVLDFLAYGRISVVMTVGRFIYEWMTR